MYKSTCAIAKHWILLSNAFRFTLIHPKKKEQPNRASVIFILFSVPELTQWEHIFHKFRSFRNPPTFDWWLFVACHCSVLAALRAECFRAANERTAWGDDVIIPLGTSQPNRQCLADTQRQTETHARDTFARITFSCKPYDFTTAQMREHCFLWFCYTLPFAKYALHTNTSYITVDYITSIVYLHMWHTRDAQMLLFECSYCLKEKELSKWMEDRHTNGKYTPRLTISTCGICGFLTAVVKPPNVLAVAPPPPSPCPSPHIRFNQNQPKWHSRDQTLNKNALNGDL